MHADNDVVVENQWTPWQRFIDGKPANAALAQVALLNAGNAIKKRLGLRTDPFRFRGSGSGIELQVSGVAGAISLREVALQVVPKFVIGAQRLEEWDTSTLFLLDALAGKHVISLLAERQQWKSHRVLDLIAYAFADAAERALRDQPIHVYKQREESTVVLQGRLNIGRQLRNLVHAPHLLECDVDQLDSENAFNDVLKWAATVLAEASRERDVKNRLRHAAQSIPGNVERSANQRYTRLLPPPQFQAWKDALEVARLLANGMSLSKKGGSSAGYSLLFNMERAFERFVEVALDHCVKTASDGQLATSRQEWATYGTPVDAGGKTLRCRPDNVLRRAGRQVMVVDAKYKLLDDDLAEPLNGRAAGAPVSQDVYELLGGMMAHGCDAGLLIYPSTGTGARGNPPIRTWRVDAYGRVLKVGALSVDLLGLCSRAQIAEILQQVSDRIGGFEATP